MLPRVLLAVALYVCAFDVLARDRAVLVYPRERWSLQRVFYTRHQAELMRELKREYELDVHRQVATDDELFAIDVTGAKLLVLSGHGDPFAIYFADRRQRTLDASDRTRLAAFLAKLDPSATILLQSCDTARGFAHLVKELAGPMRRVIAAKGEIPV
ncbi:MAG TPA: hypothetical protein VF698_14445, partial [Thermoanaerobaculia bacterium]